MARLALPEIFAVMRLSRPKMPSASVPVLRFL
jgi:hypothetical protein